MDYLMIKEFNGIVVNVSRLSEFELMLMTGNASGQYFYFHA